MFGAVHKRQSQVEITLKCAEIVRNKRGCCNLISDSLLNSAKMTRESRVINRLPQPTDRQTEIGKSVFLAGLFRLRFVAAAGRVGILLISE